MIVLGIVFYALVSVMAIRLSNDLTGITAPAL